MSYTPHLKTYPYYADLYDKHTVEKCRRFISSGKELADTKYPLDSEEEMNKILNGMSNVWTDVALEFIKGERYAQKEEAIRKWMREDEVLDEYYNNAIPPKDVTCLSCGRLMFEIHKELDTNYIEKTTRVLYMFDCPLGHSPRRAFYDNGEEYRINPHKCKSCQSSVSEEVKREGKTITTTYTCKSCSVVEVDVFNLSEKTREEPIDVDFVSDREKYCLTKEEGDRYIMGTISLNNCVNLFSSKEIEGKVVDTSLHEKVKNLKKINILELEDLLQSKLEDTQYVRFSLKDPVSGREFYVPFVVCDKSTIVNEHATELHLAKIIKDATEDTNWRLMSDDISYRLGMLTGRLRAYEREDDLLELVRVRSKN